MPPQSVGDPVNMNIYSNADVTEGPSVFRYGG